MIPSLKPPSSLLHVDAIGTAVCVLLTTLFVLIGVQPLWRQEAAAAEIHKQVRTTNESCSVLETKLTTLRKRIDRYQQVMPAHPIDLVSVSTLNRRLDSLIQQAKRDGLVVDEVRRGESDQTEHLRMTTIHLRASGAYLDCVTFLARLHANFKDMAVTRVDLEAVRTGRWSAQCTVGLTWYTVPD